MALAELEGVLLVGVALAEQCADAGHLEPVEHDHAFGIKALQDHQCVAVAAVTPEVDQVPVDPSLIGSSATFSAEGDLHQPILVSQWQSLPRSSPMNRARDRRSLLAQ